MRSFAVSTYPGAPALSQDGSRVAVGDWDGRMVEWDAVSGDMLADAWTPAPANHATAAFSPDGETIAMADLAGNIHLWRAGTTDPIGPP